MVAKLTSRIQRRKLIPIWARTTFLGVGLLGACLFGVLSNQGSTVSSDVVEEVYGGRKLLTTTMAPSAAPTMAPTLALCTADDVEQCICTAAGMDPFGADNGGGCKSLSEGGGMGLFPAYLFILLYMFGGIAIVCDELFVPALEIIAENWELSNDVAGATLMAAGGSAPELATSTIGTFARSDVGFGTIVGSAVFNVLFVIGMCAMATPEKFCPLELTWWPLFRDCTYYIITLAALAIWMFDGKVELYEAIIQFLLYVGYVVLMKYSEQLEAWVKKEKNQDKIVPEGEMVQADKKYEEEKPTFGDVNATFTRPSTFRAGILQLLTSKTDIMETASVVCVAKIKGDVNEVFEKLDENKNGMIEPNELKTLLVELGTDEIELTDEAIQTAVKGISEGEGSISKDKFILWYTKSEQRIESDLHNIFKKYDTNDSGTIEKAELADLLKSLKVDPSDEDIEQAEKEINQTEGEINYNDFKEWIKSSDFWDKLNKNAEEAAEACESMWEGLVGGLKEISEPDTPCRAKIVTLASAPLQLVLCLIPDCRPPGKEGLCYLTFIGSICFIGMFSFVMVECADILGQTLNIPTFVMGLTVLAAGTSVPDLLSSVIVAKQGEGDMAVSSSIGSNIFDVTVGLPVPWLAFSIHTLIYDCSKGVEVSGSPKALFINISILLFMVALIVVAIKQQNWKMTHGLGYIMFGLYLVYLIVAIYLEADNAAETACG